MNDDDDPPPPPGVKLRDPSDVDTLRGDLERGVRDAMLRYVHGNEYNGVRLELTDLDYADKPHYTLKEQNEAKLTDKILARRLRGTVKLVDVATNEVLDTRKNLTLARVPYLTPRATFIHNGTEYGPISQARLLPGAYSRWRSNGELETMLNVRPGTGPSMRLTLDPATGQYRLKLGSSNLHAYSVFKSLGVSDAELERRWGPQVLEINKAKYSSDALDKAYAKAVPKWQRSATLTSEQKAEAVKAALDRAQIAESIARQNLPNLYSATKSAEWRMAGAALEKHAAMDWFRNTGFEPTLSAEETLAAFSAWDFEHATAGIGAVVKRASDVSMHRPLPPHWQLDPGWIDWLGDYERGVRTEHDEIYKSAWLVAKRQFGAQFVADPTADRAIKLMEWSIDPVALLPESEKQACVDALSESYDRELACWLMRKAVCSEADEAALVKLAASRGMPTTESVSGDAMSAAADGFIRANEIIEILGHGDDSI